MLRQTKRLSQSDVKLFAGGLAEQPANALTSDHHRDLSKAPLMLLCS
jgi:hypothetical protein